MWVLDIPESIQFMREKSQFKHNCVAGKGAVEAGQDSWLLLLLFSWACKSLAAISSGGLPVSLSKPHQLGLHTHIHTHVHASVWNEDRFYVQGPSIIHGIFNVNRLLQFVTVSDLSLRWATQFTSIAFMQLPLSRSLSLSHMLQLILWHSLYGKSANDPLKWLSNNWLILRSLFMLHRCSLDPLSPLLPNPPLGPVG